MSWSLINGLGSVPALGFAGIAMGTSRGRGGRRMVVLAINGGGPLGHRIDWRGRFTGMGERIHADTPESSVPAAGESLTNILCQLWY